jgi:hypothetical protein
VSQSNKKSGRLLTQYGPIGDALVVPVLPAGEAGAQERLDLLLAEVLVPLDGRIAVAAQCVRLDVVREPAAGARVI